ncbi:MAG: hypothetical protein HC822_17390 [Oscillochloris sp.]|nr:hypothetical protein [Oscillochloris sp.]
MPLSITVVAADPATSARLAALMPDDGVSVNICTPEQLPATMPQLFIVALPGLETPEEAVIERLRADDATAAIPIIIVSALPMVQLQSVPYASDWTIAIVEEPVQSTILAETMQFLLAPPS